MDLPMQMLHQHQIDQHLSYSASCQMLAQNDQTIGRHSCTPLAATTCLHSQCRPNDRPAVAMQRRVESFVMDLQDDEISENQPAGPAYHKLQPPVQSSQQARSQAKPAIPMRRRVVLESDVELHGADSHDARAGHSGPGHEGTESEAEAGAEDDRQQVQRKPLQVSMISVRTQSTPSAGVWCNIFCPMMFVKVVYMKALLDCIGRKMVSL